MAAGRRCDRRGRRRGGALRGIALWTLGVPGAVILLLAALRLS
ncbi:hypothetical protein [Paracoccus sp. ME4]